MTAPDNCPKCKAKLEPDSNFCDQCAWKLSEPVPTLSDLAAATADPTGMKAKIPTSRLIDELKKLYSNKPNLLNNLLILGISMTLFVGLGVFKNSITGILIVTGVILIHELGHYVGMKIFGYTNVRMAFIPLFGAATSGYGTNPSGVKKAIVTLAGPVPGIFFGLVILILNAQLSNDFLQHLAVTFLVLNIFNLVPISPLDGGRFFEEILFSRSFIAEMLFKILFVIILAGVAILSRSILFGVIAFVSLISLYWVGIWANTVTDIRGKIQKDDVDRGGIPPDYCVELIRERLDTNMEGKRVTPKAYAKHVHIVWERLCNKPPSAAATIGLILLYGAVLVFGSVTSATTFFIQERASRDTKMETFVRRDGTQGQREAIYRKGKLAYWSEVNEQGFYHGESEDFDFRSGKLEKRGRWYIGKWDGVWEYYDTNGNVNRKITFDKGRFISKEELKNGQWVTTGWNELPKLERKVYEVHQRKPPEGIYNKRSRRQPLKR